MYCLNCGAAVPDQRHCPACGSVFSPEIAAQARPVARSATAVVGPAPRTVPARFMREHAPNTFILLMLGGIFGSIGTVIGSVFGGVGVATGQLVFALVGGGVLLVFGGAGWTVFAFSIRNGRRIRRIWQQGDAITGEVTQARIDRSLAIDRRSPTLVQFRYRTYSGEFSGRGYSWRLDPARLPAGTAITLLVDPQNPAQAVWVPPAGA